MQAPHVRYDFVMCMRHRVKHEQTQRKRGEEKLYFEHMRHRKCAHTHTTMNTGSKQQHIRCDTGMVISYVLSFRNTSTHLTQ